MGWVDIRAAYKAELEAVANIGVVTDFEPLTTRREQFLTYFKHAGLSYMQGFTFTREQTTETPRNQARKNDRIHLVVTRGYRAIDNDVQSERAFQELIEAVCDRLRAIENTQLNATLHRVGPPSVRIVEPREFAGYLVHYAEIGQALIEEKTF